MSRGTRLLDRVATLLVGLALVAAGLLALDWHLDVVDLATSVTLATGPVAEEAKREIVAWAVGGGGLLLGLLGLWWLLAHARRAGSSTHRLSGSAAAGRLEVDLASLSAAVADRLAGSAALDGPRGRVRRLRGTAVLEVRARLVAGADPDDLVRSAEQAQAELAAALPGEAVTCRVLVDAPGRPRTGRRTTVRVR